MMKIVCFLHLILFCCLFSQVDASLWKSLILKREISALIASVVKNPILTAEEKQETARKIRKAPLSSFPTVHYLVIAESLRNSLNNLKVSGSFRLTNNEFAWLTEFIGKSKIPLSQHEQVINLLKGYSRWIQTISELESCRILPIEEKHELISEINRLPVFDFPVGAYRVAIDAIIQSIKRQLLAGRTICEESIEIEWFKSFIARSHLSNNVLSQIWQQIESHFMIAKQLAEMNATIQGEAHEITVLQENLFMNTLYSDSCKMTEDDKKLYFDKLLSLVEESIRLRIADPCVKISCTHSSVILKKGIRQYVVASRDVTNKIKRDSTCPICFNHYRRSEKTNAIKLHPCNHKVCLGCLGSQIVSKINLINPQLNCAVCRTNIKCCAL